MYDSELILSEIKYKITECNILLIQKYGIGAKVDSVDFNLRGASAGSADLRRNRLSFNLNFFANGHYDDMMSVTVPHEVAHLWAHQNRQEPNHGDWWARAMITLGCEPKRCHNYDLGGVTNRVVYVCSCRKHHISTKKHQNIAIFGKTYVCTRCRNALKREA